MTPGTGTEPIRTNPGKDSCYRLFYRHLTIVKNLNRTDVIKGYYKNDELASLVLLTDFSNWEKNIGEHKKIAS